MARCSGRKRGVVSDRPRDVVRKSEGRYERGCSHGKNGKPPMKTTLLRERSINIFDVFTIIPGFTQRQAQPGTPEYCSGAGGCCNVLLRSVETKPAGARGNLHDC